MALLLTCAHRITDEAKSCTHKHRRSQKLLQRMEGKPRTEGEELQEHASRCVLLVKCLVLSEVVFWVFVSELVGVKTDMAPT